MTTPYCLVTGVWDGAVVGGLSLSFTDSAGAHGPITVASSGYVEHGGSDTNGICGLAGVDNITISRLGSLLKTAMEAASPTKTYTWTFDKSTGKYTVSVNSGTLAISWGSVAGYVGWFNGVSGSSSYTSEQIPYRAIKPYIGGVTNDTNVFAESGQIKTARSGAAGIYRLAPATKSWMRSWEHHFETKAAVDLDYWSATFVSGSTPRWTWEHVWQDYALAKLPLGCHVQFADGNWEDWAFTLEQPEYSNAVKKRWRANDDSRHTIRIDARLWPSTSTANGEYSRTFNAT